MVKYFFKNNSQEVKVGDEVTVTTVVSTPWKSKTFKDKLLITGDILAQLVRDGYVTFKKEEPESKGSKKCKRTIFAAEESPQDRNYNVQILKINSDSDLKEIVDTIRKIIHSNR